MKQLNTMKSYLLSVVMLLLGTTTVFGQISVPSNLVVTPSNTSVTVRFDLGTVTNTTLTSVEYSLGTVTGTTTWTGTTTSTVTGTTSGTFTATVQGLDSGTTYTMNIRVVGTNTTTTSPHTSFQFTTTALTAPLDLEAVVGNKQLTVQFTPPTDDGGNGITKYQYTTNGGTNWKDVALTRVTTVSGEPTRRQFTFSVLSSSTLEKPPSTDSLQNGTPYTFRIRAFNDNGSGEESEEVVEAPGTVPTQPFISALIARNDGFQVLFNIPTSNGGRVVENYQYSVDNGTTWVTATPTVTTSPLLIEGLNQNTLYRVRLRAVNKLGSGLQSSATQGTTHQLSAPTNLKTTVGGGTITIIFTAPTLKTAGAITNYEYSLDGGAWTVLNPVDTTSPITISGLTNGTSYKVRLRAVNAGGSGLPSEEVTEIPSGNTPVVDVQLFHNANVGSVSVLVDDEELVESLKYQTATKFLKFDAGREIKVKLVQDKTTVATLTTTLTFGKTYQVFVVGGSSGKPLEFVVTDNVRKVSTQSNQLQYRFVHGITSTGAVTLERVTNSTPRQPLQQIALNNDYGTFTNYVGFSEPGFTTLQLSASGQVLGRFLFDLSDYEGEVITLVGTGVVGSTLNVLGFEVDGTKLDSRVTTNDDTDNVEVPSQFTLYSNFPNPFNPTTNIKFDLPESANVKIQVVDVLGRQVLEMNEGTLSSGQKVITLDGSRLSSGVYYYKVVAEGSTKTYSQGSKFTLVK